MHYNIKLYLHYHQKNKMKLHPHNNEGLTEINTKQFLFRNI